MGSHISTSIPYSSHGPASFNIGQPTTSTTYSSRPTTISFPGKVNASPFVPASLPSGPPPAQHGYSGTPGVYTPDDCIHHLGTPHASMTRSSVNDNDQSEYSSFLTSLAEDKCDLLLEQFIDFDSFGTKPNFAKPVSKEEERAWSILETTTKHNGVRCESGLLWKTDNPNLPNNLFAAQRRFFNLERKFAKNEGLAVVYKNVIDTYIDYGHARKLTKKEIDDGPPGRT